MKIDYQIIIDKIHSSKKYKSLYKKTIERVVLDSFKRYPEKLVEEKAKNMLHQIWGAYWETRPDFQKLLSKIESGLKEEKTVREIFVPILQLHASTKERLPIIEDFYKQIFAITGTPNTILDYACGLNPLSVYFMGLPSSTNYHAYDIDLEEVEFLKHVFEICTPPFNVTIEPGDILTDSVKNGDSVFLFKLLPLLETQEKGSSLKILQKIKSNFLVVSYPIKSIGGNERGMVDFYKMQFETMIHNEHWESTRILFDSELVYIIKK